MNTKHLDSSQEMKLLDKFIVANDNGSFIVSAPDTRVGYNLSYDVGIEGNGYGFFFKKNKEHEALKYTGMRYFI